MKDSEKPLTEEEIRKYVTEFVCPRCGGEVETEGHHERDSSNDIHRCLKCGWSLPEMATWSVRRAPRT